MKKEKLNMGSYKRNQLIFIWTMLFMPIVAWFVFFVYINLSSFVQSFQDVYGKFSFYNYEQIFASFKGDDGLNSLSIALSNTLSYWLQHMLIIFPLQIIMAYFLYKQIPGYKVFRIIFYLPNIISSVAIVGVFKEFINPNGPLGVICQWIGIKLPDGGLLGNVATAHKTILMYCLIFGINTHLLICGAMAKIPLEVLESARLDGVQAGRELISIVLPLIWPTICTITILSCTSIIGSGGPILLMVSDAWSYGCTTISYWMWEKVYAGGSHMHGKYSLVSAAGLTLTVFVVPVVLTLRKLLEKIPTVEY